MEVKFYLTSSGANPVERYISSLPVRERAALVAAIEEIRRHGFENSGVVFRHIREKLWEIKVSMHRVFYVTLQSSTLVLLHAYKKESQKAPKNEIETALKRMKEVVKRSI